MINLLHGRGGRCQELQSTPATVQWLHWGGVQRRREQESGRRRVSRVWTNSRKWEKLRRGDSVGLIIILLRNKHIVNAYY